MTSSRRSSRSTPPPAWRAVSSSPSTSSNHNSKPSNKKSKKSTASLVAAVPTVANSSVSAQTGTGATSASSSIPTSNTTSQVSIVFAQPEQGKKLASAAEKLPKAVSRSASVKSLNKNKELPLQDSAESVPPVPPLPRNSKPPIPRGILMKREGTTLDSVVSDVQVQGALLGKAQPSSSSGGNGESESNTNSLVDATYTVDQEPASSASTPIFSSTTTASQPSPLPSSSPSAAQSQSAAAPTPVPASILSSPSAAPPTPTVASSSAAASLPSPNLQPPDLPTSRYWFSLGGGSTSKNASKCVQAPSDPSSTTEVETSADIEQSSAPESSSQYPTADTSSSVLGSAASTLQHAGSPPTDLVTYKENSEIHSSLSPSDQERLLQPSLPSTSSPTVLAPPAQEDQEVSSGSPLSWFASFGRSSRSKEPVAEISSNPSPSGDAPASASTAASTEPATPITPPVKVTPPTPARELPPSTTDDPESSPLPVTAAHAPASSTVPSQPRKIPVPLNISPSKQAQKRSSGWFAAIKASSSPNLSSPLNPSSNNNNTVSKDPHSASSYSSVDDEVPTIKDDGPIPMVMATREMHFSMRTPPESPDVNPMGWAVTCPPLSTSASPDAHAQAFPSSSEDSDAKSAKPDSSSSNKTLTRKRLSSLNPSTSRFKLSIPLLGRPKIPLEQVVSSNGGEEDKKAQDVGEKSTSDKEAPRMNSDEGFKADRDLGQQQQQKSQDQHQAKGSEIVSDSRRESGSASVSTLTATPATVSAGADEVTRGDSSSTSTSSWWGYVGWSDSSSSTSGAAPPSGAQEEGDRSGSNNEDSAAKLKSDANSPSSVTPPPMITKISDIQEIPPAPPRNKAASVTSADTTSSSAWYLPWAWYGDGATTLTQSAPAVIDTPQGGESNEVKEEMTESEMVKRDAIKMQEEKDKQRDTDSSSLSPPAPADNRKKRSASTPAHSSSADSNPIESSIYSNTSGWASFFASSSRILSGAASKTITDGREKEQTKNVGEGMEVMDIDEDDVNEERGRDHGVKYIGEGKDDYKAQVPGLANQRAENRAAAEVSAPAGPPLTTSESIKKDVANAEKNNASLSASNAKDQSKRGASHSPVPSSSAKSHKSSKSTSSTASATPAKPRSPNLVLPTWDDTFHTRPRNTVPASEESKSGGGGGKLAKTMKFVTGVLFSSNEEPSSTGINTTLMEDSTASALLPHAYKDMKEKVKLYREHGKALPRAYNVLDQFHRIRPSSPTSSRGAKGKARARSPSPCVDSGMGGVVDDVLKGCERVVVIGIHGWFPGAALRTVIGEPTGTSSKFVNMMVQALQAFQVKHRVEFKKVTHMPLEGEGTIDRRVEKLYSNLLENQEWMDDLHAADVIFVATHSQGSIVSAHILNRLLRDGHIQTSTILGPSSSSPDPASMASFSGAGISTFVPARRRHSQRVCCLALCGIHLGPLRYLSSSSVLQPYFQYFESTAARELFEFQNTENAVFKAYVSALKNVLANRVKMVYVASLDDQVVPLYSGLFTSASHPLILRALYIDGDAYHSSDFLSNLLVLLLRVLNSGLSDSGLITHLSEATAGSLNGVGHSTAYEELATYSLAVDYLFLTNDGLDVHPELSVESFNAMTEQNDYEIPWSLRDIIADERIVHFFADEIVTLRNAFREWHPKTTILRDIKRKLQPIQKLPSVMPKTATSLASVSKL